MSDYDPSDDLSILRYASRLRGHSLNDLDVRSSDVIGGTDTKGYFGQALERDYFGIENNNRPEPDFNQVGIELKVSPLEKQRSHYTVKERLVLGIIDYDKVPEMGFRTFTDKNSRILIVFYLWNRGANIRDYRMVKIVDWTPTNDDLRLIKEDWDVIQTFIEAGMAHRLTERHTRVLAACTKGVGHGNDLRHQPFSKIPAKQRALSFKPSYVNSIFSEFPDINEKYSFGQDIVDTNPDTFRGRLYQAKLTDFDDDCGSLFRGDWDSGVNFEQYILRRFEKFRGMSCKDIECELSISLSSKAKSYYSSLTMAMMGVVGKKHVREFQQANIEIKTIRLRSDGRSKESMSFPAFKYEDVVSQEWEDSDFFNQLDHIFFFPVFQFEDTNMQGVDRKDLLFKGAFFWSISDHDLEVVKSVWVDTQDKLKKGIMNDFIKMSDGRISHVRPHARNSEDTYPFRGKRFVKKCFWLNSDYLTDVVKEGLRDSCSIV